MLRTDASLTAPDIQVTLALLGMTPDMQLIQEPGRDRRAVIARPQEHRHSAARIG